ncbi:oligomeric Golgi complex subunit 6 [Entophlyctis helioformis]|nr:oligomeric Golgi complex subunit 6 [Entophlyctis helioformis]
MATMLSASTDELQPQNKLATANPLSRKLAKMLHLSLDEPETQEALVALSAFYKENSTASRRNLKSDIEKRVIGVNKRFLTAFETVQQQLLEIEKQIDGIGDRCATMDAQLKSAYNDTAAVLKHTHDLKAKSELSMQRKFIIDTFLKRFTLSDEEIHALTTSGDTVDNFFFSSLKHLQQIQDDCKTLLISDHQQLGLEIIATTNMYQEAAFERLFRWTQAECRLMKTELPEITVELKQGIQALRQRPIMFQECMEEVSNIRRSAIVRGFQDALTVGGPGGFPRPIEFHAHDAQRYIGDILAWIHQACVSEREMLEGLFGLASSSSLNRRRASIPTPSALSPLEEIDGFRADEELLLQILDKNLEGVCRPLQHRVESVLASGIGPITSYRIANLIQFYTQTVVKTLGTFSQLSVSLEALTDSAFKVFFDTLNAQASDMLRFVQSPEQDLQPPQAVKDTIAQLREIMLSYDGSLLSAEEREQEFGKIIGTLMDPVLQMCLLGSSHLKPLDSAIYMVNCLYHIQVSRAHACVCIHDHASFWCSFRACMHACMHACGTMADHGGGQIALAAFSFAASQVQVLESQIDGQVEVLVSEQYAVILRQSGLSSLVQHMEAAGTTPLGLARGSDARSVAEAMSRLDIFLVTVTVDVADTLSRISSVQIARRVTQQGFRKFVETYRAMVGKIMDPENKYEFPSTLVTRTVEEVETLLSLQG